MLCRPSLLLATVFTLGGCVPMVVDRWDVQPVNGHVFLAESGAPLPGALITNQQNPDVRTTTDADGRFTVPGQSTTTLHWAMPASYLDAQTWIVSHPSAATGVAVTTTLAPPIHRQPTTVEVPMFETLPSTGPNNCPLGPYRVRLVEHLLHNNSLSRNQRISAENLGRIACSDPAQQALWDTRMAEFWQSAD